MEETIFLSSAELVHYTILYKQKKEILFKRDFLLSKGLSQNSEAIVALTKELDEIEQSLKPLEEKIKKLDLIFIVPNKAEIDTLSTEISQYSKTALSEALEKKTGPIYELLKKRAKFLKENFTNKECIAKIVLLANMLPRKEAEKLALLLEANVFDVIDVSSLSDSYKEELVKNLRRLRFPAVISANNLSIKPEGEKAEELIKEQVQKVFPESKTQLWILKENEQKWDELANKFKEVSGKLQILLTKSQAEKLSEEELVLFDSLQAQYLQLKKELQALAVEPEKDLVVSFFKPVPKENPPAGPAKL
ncbi:MAG: hypothetical protein N3D10_02065 [Candidatus Micrarchaeota archaeon]|nr:hypothetical protein [Candidatus Micrarchaeota archaeon]